MANIIEVTDFQHPALDVFARLTQLQLRSGWSRRRAFLLQRAQR